VQCGELEYESDVISWHQSEMEIVTTQIFTEFENRSDFFYFLRQGFSLNHYFLSTAGLKLHCLSLVLR
jgi:hypothetical protein